MSYHLNSNANSKKRICPSRGQRYRLSVILVPLNSCIKFSLDMNSIDFYQPPTKAGMPGNRRPTMSNLGVPTASGQGNSATALILNNEPSGRFQDYDLVEFLDMSAPEPKGFFNSFCEPAPELNGIEVDAKSKDHLLCFRWMSTNNSRYLVRP